MELFKYAVIKDEKTDKDGEVTDEAQLLVEPTHILARDQNQAAIMAARAIPEDHIKDLDRVRVVISPF